MKKIIIYIILILSAFFPLQAFAAVNSAPEGINPTVIRGSANR